MLFFEKWKMIAEYEDGSEIIVGGETEQDCMGSLISKEEKHGRIVWYSGFSDSNYEAGEYIGQENFIYD